MLEYRFEDLSEITDVPFAMEANIYYARDLTEKEILSDMLLIQPRLVGSFGLEQVGSEFKVYNLFDIGNESSFMTVESPLEFVKYIMFDTHKTAWLSGRAR